MTTTNKETTTAPATKNRWHSFIGFKSGQQRAHVGTNFDTPCLTYHDSQYRPHWVRGGYGNLYVKVEAGTDGSIQIQTTEQAEGKRVGKETWASLPVEAARVLRDFLVANVKDA